MVYSHRWNVYMWPFFCWNIFISRKSIASYGWLYVWNIERSNQAQNFEGPVTIQIQSFYCLSIYLYSVYFTFHQRCDTDKMISEKQILVLLVYEFWTLQSRFCIIIFFRDKVSNCVNMNNVYFYWRCVIVKYFFDQYK